MTDFFKSAFGLFGTSQSSSTPAGSLWYGNNSNNNPNTKTSQPTNEFVGKVIMIGNLKLRVAKLLAEGGFAIVYVVVDTTNGNEYALKVNRLIN